MAGGALRAGAFALLQAAPHPALRLLAVVGAGALGGGHRAALALRLTPRHAGCIAQHAQRGAVAHAARHLSGGAPVGVGVQQAVGAASVDQRTQQAGGALAGRLQQRARGQQQR